jgi:50S ribosomal protein L16 3-hydroxylase
VLLSSWLAPLDGFIEGALGKAPLFLPPTEERARSVASLTSSWRAPDLCAQALRTEAWVRSLEGGLKRTPVTQSAAAALYAAGMTVYLQELPFLEPVIEEATRSLVFARKSVECALFCNHPGAKTPYHFDSVDTIAIQVTGSKEWRLAKNTHAPEPTANWVPRTRPAEELRRYAHDGMPEQMPPDATTYRLEPGAVIYVPRGYWHETFSGEESVSMHLHLVPTTWVDVLLETLRGRLVRDEALRKHAYPLFHPGRADLAPAEALARLKEAVAELALDDLVRVDERPIGADDAVVRRARTSVAFDRDAEDPELHVATIEAREHGHTSTTELDLSGAYLRAARLLAEQLAPRTVRDLARAADMPLGDALELVGALRRAGLVRLA